MQHLILDNEIDISLTGFEVTEIPVHWRVRIQRLARDTELTGQRRTLRTGCDTPAQFFGTLKGQGRLAAPVDARPLRNGNAFALAFTDQ